MYIPPDKGITGVQLTKSDSRVSPATIQHHLHRKPSYNIQPKLPISHMDQLQQRLAQPQSTANLGTFPAVTIPTTAMPGGAAGPAVSAQPIKSQGSMLAQLLTQVNLMKAPAREREREEIQLVHSASTGL